MADLRGGHEPAVSNGNGMSSRTRPGPAQGGSPSGIRTPRVIMQERHAREAARRAAEQEQMERERVEQERLRMRAADEEARAMEDARRNVERRAAATAAGGSRPRGGSNDMPAPLDTPRRRNEQAAADRGSSSRAPQASQTQARPGRTTTSAAPPQFIPSQAGPSSQPAGQGAPPPVGGNVQSGTPRNSFPHAFERWENLSAQWEGLTSHWIKRMEMNAQSYDDDPISKQLTRQVTDLSAAGANLFHAVVELQRLRASSERKFQRWFFETRTELERAQETNAMLESRIEELRGQLNQEQSRTHERDSASSIIQKQLGEMKKELAISKEEARRAWEELGRREQEERERTASLQSGQPTIVGGVQVVPMTQGVPLPSRRGSTRDDRYRGDYDGGAGPSGAGGYGPEYSQAPPVQPTTTTSGQGAYYTSGPEGAPGYGAGGSEGGYSEEDYETTATHPGGYTSAATSGDSQWAGAYAPPQDYTGAGYGGGAWGSQHHHPSRLSDVPEEEESRTSASQVSRG